MVYQGNLLSKTLVIGIIILFIGISAFPTVSNSIRNNTGISLITIKVAGEMGLNDWYISDVGFTFTNESSDIAEIIYFINGGPLQTYTEPFYISDDGEDICLSWFAVDYEGNQSEDDGPFFFSIDQTPPEFTADDFTYEIIGGNQHQGWDYLLTVNATDAMSGMDHVEFYINDVLQETVVGHGPTYQWQFKYWGNLHIFIKAGAYDIAGNSIYQESEEPCKMAVSESPQVHVNISEDRRTNRCLDNVLFSEVVEIKNDRIIAKSSSDTFSRGVFDPAYVIVVFNREIGENGWIVSNVSIPIFYESDRINRVYYQINDGEWMLYTDPLVISEDGIYVFSWYAVDSEGYTSTPDSISFKVDQTPPFIDLSYEIVGEVQWESWDFLFTATATDDMSGMDRVKFYLDDLPKETVYGPGPVYKWEFHYLYNFWARGLILNKKITDEFVSFYAIIVKILGYSDNTYSAYAYDNAGNWNCDIISDYINNVTDMNDVYLFQKLILPNSYSGYLGRFFIFAFFDTRYPF